MRESGGSISRRCDRPVGRFSACSRVAQPSSPCSSRVWAYLASLGCRSRSNQPSVRSNSEVAAATPADPAGQGSAQPSRKSARDASGGGVHACRERTARQLVGPPRSNTGSSSLATTVLSSRRPASRRVRFYRRESATGRLSPPNVPSVRSSLSARPARCSVRESQVFFVRRRPRPGDARRLNPGDSFTNFSAPASQRSIAAEPAEVTEARG